MSVAASSFLLEAFFDQPQVLGVRFVASLAGGPVERFARSRAPDVTPVGCSGISIPLVVGLAAAGLVMYLAIDVMRGYRAIECGNGTLITNTVERDVYEDAGWRGHLSSLATDLAPRRDDLRPYAVSVLLEVPHELARDGDASGGWLRPRHANNDDLAKRRGAVLATTFAAAGLGRETAVILDLPGPTSVAAAAGLAQHCDPVFTMDNLPHPAGVVPSGETLGAVVYWRPTLVALRSVHDNDSPALFVLDANRLTPYRNESDRFDNRSCARLPDVTGFTKLGVKRILYIRPHRGDVTEADDLNALFVACAAAGIEVRHLGLDSVEAPVVATTSSSNHGTSSAHWFWNSYGWNRPQTFSGNGPTNPDALYRAASRPLAWEPTTSSFDGGARQHDAAIKRLAQPAGTSWASDGDGGSWSRSTPSSSSWGG